MSTKTVSLSEEAYEQLKQRKKEGESFSDTFKRLTGEQSLMKVAGIFKEKKIGDNIKKVQDATQKELEETRESLQ
jgi:predicted CopG family antitoxin